MIRAAVDWIFDQTLVRLSIAINVHILDGKPEMTISARAWVDHWPKTEAVINLLFWIYESDHCRKAYIRYLERIEQ